MKRAQCNSADDKWLRWQAWMQAVESDIRDMALYDAVFRMSMRAIHEWPKKRRTLVYPWIVAMYARDIAVRVRRVLDRRKGTRSFRRLLDEIAADPTLLSVQRFTASYPPGLKSAGAEIFERLVESGRGHITSRAVHDDIAKLEQVWKRSGLEDVTNNFIVHPGDADLEKAPSWQEVHDFVAEIEDTCRRYCYLLLQADFGSLLPAVMEDVESDVATFWLGSPIRPPGRLLAVLKRAPRKRQGSGR